MSSIASGEQLARNTKLRNTYQVRSVLSCSDTAIVYGARLLETGEKVVVKEFFPAALVRRWQDKKTVICQDDALKSKYVELMHQFLREAQLIKELKHSGVVQYIDHFEENGTCYFVMEYCAGSSLDEVVRQQGQGADTAFLLRTLEPLIETLEYIHRQGIIHRDIKPAHILIHDSGSVKLIGFGSAIHYKGRENQIAVSAGYSPPEFYANRSRQGPASDIYSLAATLYYCCKGTPPPEVPVRLFSDEMEPVKRGISPLPYVIKRGLAVQSTKRIRSLKWFKAALKAEYVIHLGKSR
ncbi:serine/threonine protein kinase [Paenibacillus sp. P96]|uniref:Serine/threonine protein kinase n=1 Tax=Paenibacillus zeirhizosphaerae TaxID=2987519 RepID=A0ABT9FL66_9BACL|nr:serine/threonine-protein kinase [Paenibacillus sp. P96]MDP4095276.1 serine/threonine protein kinase [Paenibacillus sp. P96]